MTAKKHTIPETAKFWFSLDNAAKIFPAIITREVTTVFRLTAVLKQRVKIQALRKALLLAEKRFPYYKVQLKQGFFWYYLEHLPMHIPIEVDDRPCCRKFSKGELLIRVLVKDNRISIEISHILTDGGGGFEFLKAILIWYAQACDKKIAGGYNFQYIENQISEEEYEDAYKRYFKENIPPTVKKTKAFHLPYPVKPPPRFDRMNVTLSLKHIKRVADEKGVSITVYLVSVYLFTLEDIYENLGTFKKYKKNKVIRVQVPVNLRKIFPSRTMRNFSLFVMPEIDTRLGHYTFDEIIKTVYHQIHLETDEKLINKNISRNVGSEKKIYVRSIPLFIKSLILKMKHKSLGPAQYSGVVTNLGKATLPAETEEMIDHFVITPPPPNDLLKINCGIIGFGDKLVLSFGNITHSKAFEQKFLQFLENRNIQVQVEENE
ncbi:MAG: hypothetical protein K9H65_06415 [Bacteroidales bacterium]|nr:hypothetical protein [Bacteroidales bacterium]